MRRAIVVALLLSVALVPITQGNGGVIDSVVIIGDGEIGEGPIDVNITLIGVGGASSASVNWSATLTDIEGNPIDSDSGNSLVDDGVVTYVETILGNAPLGFSNLTVTLSGDVGAPGQDQWVTYHSTIQRLRPLDISLGAPIYNPVDSSEVETGNLTINDGDYVKIEVPVINGGDVIWNGSLNISLDSIDMPAQTVDADADSTVIYTFLTNQVAEGIHYVNATLNGPSDSNPSDDIFSGQFEVGPPPLPLLELSLERLVEPEPGSQIEWNLRANNTGESTFDGQLICLFDGEQISSTNATITVSNSVNTTVSMVSKPGELVCTSSGARTSSTTNASETISMTSAVFIGAGHSTPSLLGGPWHAGDEITLSILLRNEGDAVGSASMQVEIDGIIHNGSTTTLEGGMAGEVHHDFSFTTSGDHIVNWSVVSIDGAVDSNLSGSMQIPVLSSQIVIMEIESVDVAEDGVELSWVIDLSEGRDRMVILNFGAIQDGLKGEKIVEERHLLPGRTYGVMNIGFQDGQQVFASLSESGWTIGFGSYTDDESDMPQFAVLPQVTVNPSTQPKVPVVDSQVTVYYTLSNSGVGATPQGQIVITDGNGHIIASDVSPVISSGSTDSSTVVTWPSGDNVKIIVTWYIDGQSVSDEVLILSESVGSSEEEFSIPWGGILGGLAVGMVLIFAIRIKNSPTKEKKEKKQKEKNAPVKDEKVEVACPSCDRRLRVPRVYSGGVRCPECETKFDVEGEEESEEKVEEESVASDEHTEETVEEKPEQLWSSSADDILGCPKCTRKLKVPYDRRPAKARCPACETIFEARAE